MVGLLLCIILLAPIIAGVSYLISKQAFKIFEKNNSANARNLAGYVFVGCFLVQLAIIIIMIVTNARLGR